MRHTFEEEFRLENPQWDFDNNILRPYTRWLEVKLLEARKQSQLNAVSKVLPTMECVEQWWAEGRDKNPLFWKEAPYRTNGDVIEEIKTALKYFIETWQR